ncbi:MAG: hypothetical protein ABH983_03515 [Candidatus Micrarchaeota archaeon]
MDAETGVPVADGGDPENPDTLRTLVIYTDDVEDVSSSGESELEAGDYVSLVEEPTAWKLSYKGLDVTPEDRFNLKFEIETSDKDISASKGPQLGPGNSQVACILFAPYIKVTSGATGSIFETNRIDGPGGTLSDNEFFIFLNDGPTPGTTSLPGGVLVSGNRAARCDIDGDGTIEGSGDDDYGGAHIPGDMFMKISHSSNDYGLAYIGDQIEYPDIADGDNEFAPPEGGLIQVGWGDDVDTLNDEIGILLDSAGAICGAGACGENPSDGTEVSNSPNLWFAIAEKAGTGPSNEFVDYFLFAVDGTETGDPSDATFDFAWDDGSGFSLVSDDQELLYGHAVGNPTPGYYSGSEPSGPVTPGVGMVEEGYISERGSVFDMIDDNTVEFDMAHRLIRAEWWLGPSETTSASDSTTIVTLFEGDSEVVGGVTVKLLEITEDVGACSAAGGAVSCTADMSGVSAVVMPNNAPSVEVAVPYTGNYGNLVVLDTDAVGLNTVIAVGGDAVNSVSSDLLAGSPVDWTTETTVVREVTAGKIVVAGAEASDTMQAGKDFLAQLQNA